jgi:uncharacterized Zn finger protein
MRAPAVVPRVKGLVQERTGGGELDSWGVSSLRKEIAALSGDVDVYVAVLAEEARGGRDYGEIVSVLRKAGRDRDAEEWARKGLEAEPASPWTDALREQLADLLLGSERGDEAVAMYREVFERRTLHQDFLRLRNTAEQVRQWLELRDWALDYMRDRARTDKLRQVRLGQLITVLLRMKRRYRD